MLWGECFGRSEVYCVFLKVTEYENVAGYKGYLSRRS